MTDHDLTPEERRANATALSTQMLVCPHGPRTTEDCPHCAADLAAQETGEREAELLAEESQRRADAAEPLQDGGERETDPILQEAIGLLRELAADLSNRYVAIKGLPEHLADVERVIADLENSNLRPARHPHDGLLPLYVLVPTPQTAQQIITQWRVVADEPTFADPMPVHGNTPIEKDARELLARCLAYRPEDNPKLQVRTNTIGEWRDA